MIIDSYTFKVLTASSEKVLTQKEEVDVANRVVSKKIYLAANDSEDNYIEIDEEKGKHIIATQDEYYKNRPECSNK